MPTETNTEKLSFGPAQFNRLFPFYILLDKELQVKACGESLKKLCPACEGRQLEDFFQVQRPAIEAFTYEALLSLCDQLVVLEIRNTPGRMVLRGQMEKLEETNQLLFLGSPWFGSMEQVKESGLNIHDFAYNDPLIDLLHVLKTQEITNDDLKELLRTVSKQKEALKTAADEVREVALFPLQNPDPLYRVKKDGTVVMLNPAALRLHSFLYKGRQLSIEEVWKTVIGSGSQSATDFTFEAEAEGKTFAFTARFIDGQDYYNIYSRDVTLKRQAEAELRRLSLVASANQNGVMFTDPEGRITWANNGFLEMSGYSEEEIMGKTPTEICRGPLTEKEELKKTLNAFYSGQAFNVYFLHYRKNGSTFWAHVNGQPIKDESGNVIQYFGIIEDITQQRANEEKLQVLSQIAEDNINGVVIADSQGLITWANKSFTQMTGYPMEEVIGRKPGQLLQGPETDPETIAYLRHQVHNGLPFNAEILNYTKDGKKYWSRIQGQAIRNNRDELTGFFALKEDITKERESEFRLRKVLESLGDNVWEHDFRTGKTYFSKSDNSFLGYKTEELSNNEDLWWNSVHPDDLYLLEENDRRYKNGLADSHSLEYRVINKDKTIHWVLDRGVVIEKDHKGLPLRITGTHTDITISKQTEAELANRVKQFRSLSENIPGVIYEYEFRKDGTGRICYLSPAIHRIFGVTPEQFIQHFSEYVLPEDRERIEQKNLVAAQTLEPYHDESRLFIPGRGIIWRSVSSAFSHYSEEGNAVYTGFMMDVTERKKAEQRLEEQRKFYEDILNNMPADIAVFNQRHEYLFVNPKGIKDPALRSWIIGKTDEDYCIRRNRPLQIAEQRRQTFNVVATTKQPSEWEERNVKPDGEEEYILRRWFPVTNENGEVTLVIGYGIDITQRKQFEVALKRNEEKYRSIIANMNLGLMEIDKNRRVVYANETMAVMTGYPVNKVIGTHTNDFLPPESLVLMNRKVKDKKNIVSEAFELQVKVKLEKRWWLVSSAPRFSESGEFEGMIVICLDIHQQKEMEKQLLQARERAEQLARTREIFLANMSHEIRTPMNAIIGMGNQLAKTELQPQQSFFLNTITTAAENLLVIINDILDLSKIEAGKLSVEKIGFEPRKVVYNAIQVLLHKAEEKGLALTNSLCDIRIAPVLIGDPYRLNQVLLNLISNAIKFTETGSVDVQCMVLEDKPDYQLVQAKVTDTGIGMDQDFVDKLFDKFSQEYESVTRKFGGTGLGMSISKELIELMGGEIEVESIKGKGTSMLFRIPFRKGSVEDLPMAETQQITGDFLKNKTILVTDDNEMNRLVAATILENYGALIIEAMNGEEAVSVINKTAVDLVLMDIQMPVMNGYEATKLLRKQGHQLPVIALTANAIKGESEKCLNAGMDDYVAKPFKEEELLKKIAHGLHTEISLINQQETKPGIAEASLYSLANLEIISRGNPAFVEKMVRVFCEQTPSLVKEMQQAFAAGRYETMGSLAHKLKPSIDNLGIDSLKEVIRAIERRGKENNGLAELPALLAQTAGVLEKVISQMKEKLQT